MTDDLPTRRSVLVGLGAGGALLALGGLGACTGTPSSSDDPTPTSSVPGPDFAEPPEVTSANGRLDVTLVAAPATVPYAGSTRWALTYNGSTPGPTLRVRPGDVLTITLENGLDAPTNLHTHGLHVSPSGESDNVFVMVEPGESRTYRYEIRPDHPSGTFWYHPHHHGSAAPQVFGGMVGAIIVEDDVDDLPELVAASSRLLVLADPTIGDSASVLDASMMQVMSGREGDAVVVNGLSRPRLEVRTGSLEHWRLVNASPSRYYALQLDGLPMHLVATDAGRLARPQEVDEVLLVPGARAEVLVAVADAATHTLTTRAVDRGGMGMMGPGGGMGGGMGGGSTGSPTTIMELDIVGDDAAAPALPDALSAVGPSPDRVTRTRDLTLAMEMGMGMGMGMGAGDGQFTIDGRSFDPDRVDIETELDSVEDWVIRNTSPMDHPFHLHVWPFQVIESSAGAVIPGWRDTVNVPAGGSVTIRIPFRDFAGKAVYHCHILDHEDRGMMGVIDVQP